MAEVLSLESIGRESLKKGELVSLNDEAINGITETHGIKGKELAELKKGLEKIIKELNQKIAKFAVEVRGQFGDTVNADIRAFSDDITKKVKEINERFGSKSQLKATLEGLFPGSKVIEWKLLQPTEAAAVSNKIAANREAAMKQDSAPRWPTIQEQADEKRRIAAQQQTRDPTNPPANNTRTSETLITQYTSGRGIAEKVKQAGW